VEEISTLDASWEEQDICDMEGMIDDAIIYRKFVLRDEMYEEKAEKILRFVIMKMIS